MVHGWLIGEVLKRALNSSEWRKDQHAFKESLYNQRRYVVDDIVFGDFGGDCIGNAAGYGAMCHCNQGGKTVYLKHSVENGRIEPLEKGLVQLGTTTCFSEGFKMHAPLVGMFINMTDDPLALRVGKELFAGASLLNGDGRLGQHDRLFVHSINTTTGRARDKLQEECATRVVTAVFGVVTDELLGTPNMTFIDPVSLVPRLTNPRRNVIHLTPTLEQQFFAVVKYLSQKRSHGLHVIVRGSESAAIADALFETLWTFGVSSSSYAILGNGELLRGRLPTRGHVMVVGLFQSDVELLAEHLHKHTEVSIFVSFSELAVFYSEFTTAFRDTSVRSRLFFPTSLPSWNDVSSSSETVKAFNEHIRGNKALRTPLTMLGFATGRLMQEILPLMPVVNATILTQFFYTNIAAVADGMHYGPFSESKCSGLSFGEMGCAVNYGAKGISVLSLAYVLGVGSKEVQEPFSGSVVYRDHLYLGMPLSTFMGVLVAFLIVVALLGFLIFMQFFRRDARDNRNAPKMATAPVTLVFTDIESSTAQWAANPQLMPNAVAAHHRLIRSLIMRYGCYEVKTIGDSFMIACRSPFSAVQLVQDLQRQFLDHNWGTTAFDESYRAFEEQRAEEDAEYVPPTARLEPKVYQQLWNGLRVRAGVHTGLCDIRHDEVTKGYDYYGGTSNMAARTESVAHGGQVLLTRATYMGLTASERQRLDVTPLGAVPLRGVPKPVEMYQLNVVPGRTFRPLRLDAEIDENCEEGTGTSTSETSSNAFELTRSAKLISFSLQSLLSTFPFSDQRKMLLTCCERWRINTPKTNIEWNTDVLKDVINRIGMVVGKVMEPKLMRGDMDYSTNASSEQNSLHGGNKMEPSTCVSPYTDRRHYHVQVSSGRKVRYNVSLPVVYQYPATQTAAPSQRVPRHFRQLELP
ncbi:Adenylate and Guanylate cyclase catalytic domain [Trypanosoma vivax]|nr:Adenylate and Guanylate cyclase catalytic domain [Trypanosoma vivax]